MCWAGDAERPDFISESMRTACKPHRCGECGRTINPGERYEYVAGKWDGSLDIYKTCAHCKAARRWLSIACNGWIYTCVYEELLDHWVNEPDLRSMTLARLIASMRRHWHDGRADIPDRDAVRASIPEVAQAA